MRTIGQPISTLVLTSLLLLAGSFTPSAYAGPTRVGNGDDGSDLEGATPIAAGPVIDARAKAIEQLKKVNSAGLPTLGTLIPEIESSPMYEAKKDVSATLPEDQGSFHTDMRGQVYARTFAHPHAATRVFPTAEKLDQEQLVALLIHEGLHRSLPASVREDEHAVAAITLALTSPNASFDQARDTLKKVLPEADYTGYTPPPAVPMGAGGSEYIPVAGEEHYPIPENAQIKQPSTVGYAYTHFSVPSSVPGRYPISSMHVIKSYLYPFGSDRAPFGIGIQASLLGIDQGSQAGPLEISSRLRVWSGRGYDVGIWGVASVNMLSADELKNSPFGRDVGTLGISMRKELQRFYVENFLSLTFDGTSDRTIGVVDYTYSYGKVVNVSSHVGALIGKLHLGGFVEVFVADYYRETDNAIFNYDPGRFRIVSAGPEVTWQEKDFAVNLSGRFLLDATKGANFDQLGNIMGAGVGQGSVSLGVSLFF